ncbi:MULTISPECIES: MAPEG family protein [Pseudoalteromonas]|jgi:hypothetical protein|uniref:MAPEG family protein n=1 Tax=Pseudoalteromonas prydzensis TaxID=182141 RepID=A0ABR9FG50_9GAMM|nr:MULTISPECIES: MAPEG family protein [Pseudoalteromonas]MBE0380201.1 hypothetical protein [Pseudoalteromonas prydzensis ACAM 620]MBE0456014.1 MAPEG family protein [Pseudoalteromonas prydzensis]WKD25871.1 MAPEG family protein [Pseudoalteromonas sp. KG3]
MEKYLLLAMFAQVMLTFTVMVVMGRRRFSAARNKTISMQDFATMQLDKAGDDVHIAGRNFINQFEIPVLFFVASVTGLQLNAAGYVFVALAWGFVISRVIHSIIHLGSNSVKPRYYSFLLGCLLVLTMWVLLVMQVFAL